MLYVNNFGCRYHAGENTRCTCSIFESDTSPTHSRIFALPVSDNETVKAAKAKYRGLDDPRFQKEGFQFVGFDGQGNPAWILDNNL